MPSARRSWNVCSIGKRRDPVTRSRCPLSNSTLPASGTRRSLGTILAIVAAIAVVCLVIAGSAIADPRQPQPAPAPAAIDQPAARQSAPPAEHAIEPAGQGGPASGGEAHAKEPGKEAAGHGEGEGEAEHTESTWAWVARLFNFVILVGGLVYLLRSPLVGFLEQRGITVRSELMKAAELKSEAAAQVAQIDARMAALPAEIESLKRRGAEEIAAEETRIRALAATERKRLLDQATREIETQLRIAERDLKNRAGELAIAVATERVTRTITAKDHARLVDRYVAQVGR